MNSFGICSSHSFTFRISGSAAVFNQWFQVRHKVYLHFSDVLIGSSSSVYYTAYPYVDCYFTLRITLPGYFNRKIVLRSLYYCLWFGLNSSIFFWLFIFTRLEITPTQFENLHIFCRISSSKSICKILCLSTSSDLLGTRIFEKIIKRLPHFLGFANLIFSPKGWFQDVFCAFCNSHRPLACSLVEFCFVFLVRMFWFHPVLQLVHIFSFLIDLSIFRSNFFAFNFVIPYSTGLLRVYSWS